MHMNVTIGIPNIHWVSVEEAAVAVAYIHHNRACGKRVPTSKNMAVHSVMVAEHTYECTVGIDT